MSWSDLNRGYVSLTNHNIDAAKMREYFDDLLAKSRSAFLHKMEQQMAGDMFNADGSVKVHIDEVVSEPMWIPGFGLVVKNKEQAQEVVDKLNEYVANKKKEQEQPPTA